MCFVMWRINCPSMSFVDNDLHVVSKGEGVEHHCVGWDTFDNFLHFRIDL